MVFATKEMRDKMLADMKKEEKKKQEELKKLQEKMKKKQKQLRKRSLLQKG
tara:strand:+ start:2186 stop:2338 length:153 start_codon:yes stop_codon:yes gene_type:complete